MYSLIKCVTFLSLKASVSINVIFRFFYKIDFFLIKKFERFKERVRFKLKVTIHNVLFR